MLASKHPRVLAVLLESFQDYALGPSTWPDNPLCQRQPSATMGLAPSAWKVCPTCDGEGKAKRGKSLVRCPRCLGHGGWHFDPYDQQQRELATETSGKPRCMDARELDLALARTGEAPDRLIDSFLREGKYRRSPRCYRQLTEALSRLGRGEQQMLQRVYILGLCEARLLPAREAVLLIRAVQALAAILPSSFVAPAWAIQRATETLEREHRQRSHRSVLGRKHPAKGRLRSREIQALSLHGHTQSEIGKRYGISRQAVQQQLARAA